MDMISQADGLLAELYKMNPMGLSQALHCLEYLVDRSWIDISSIDAWLMHAWEAVPLPQARYIPSPFITPTSVSDEDDEDTAELDREIDTFRGLFDDLPARGTPCPFETLVYVLNCGPSQNQKANHFCVIVFAPSIRAIYLLGKDYLAVRSNESQDWESWNGLQIWKKVCRLMGWVGMGPMVIRREDWKQNGYDCGPIACQVVQHIVSRGMRTDGPGRWKRPTMMGCCHMLRMKMAELVHKSVTEGSRAYSTVRALHGAGLRARYGDGLDGMDMAHEETEGLLRESPVEPLQRVVRNLRRASQKCPTCHATLEAGRHRAAAQAHPIPLRPENVNQAAVRHRDEELEGAQPMKAYVTGGLVESDSEGGGGSGGASSGEEGQELVTRKEDGEGGDREALTVRPQRATAPSGMQARLGRFPRPLKGPALPSRPNLEGLLLPFDREFDEYEGGPVLEELAPVPETHLQLRPSYMYVCEQIMQIMLTPAPYSLFKDYGYRLLPCFAQGFELGKAILVEEHLCPVGLAEPPKSIKDYACHPRKGRNGDEVRVVDTEVVGAERLLQIADEEGDDMILLTGRTMEGSYVCVDMLQDHVEPDDLDFSCDVDSLIWITQKPKFKGPVDIYSLPIIRDRAPIWKSNHVQIQVLHPQTEEDQTAIGGRTEWMTTMQSLSTIPHLLFGVVKGSSLVELLIFFPRMMHKDPHRHFRVNRIPKIIQDFFWDHVLLPALRSVIPSTRSAYLPVDRAHSAFKMGSGKQASFALDPEGLGRLVKKMKRIVRDLLCRLIEP